MKLCYAHNDEVRKALRGRDLWRLVQPERASELAQRWLTGEMRNEADFDPYVVVWLELNARAADFLPIGFPLANPTKCPICETERYTGKVLGKLWIERYADFVYALAVRMGRAKPPRSGRIVVEEGALRDS